MKYLKTSVLSLVLAANTATQLHTSELPRSLTFLSAITGSRRAEFAKDNQILEKQLNNQRLNKLPTHATMRLGKFLKRIPDVTEALTIGKDNSKILEALNSHPQQLSNFLITKHQNLNNRDNDGNTLLHLTIGEKNYSKLYNGLLKAGAAPHAINYKLLTPVGKLHAIADKTAEQAAHYGYDCWRCADWISTDSENDVGYYCTYCNRTTFE